MIINERQDDIKQRSLKCTRMEIEKTLIKGGEHQGEHVDSSWLQKIFLQILLGSVKSLWIWFEYDIWNIWYTVCSIQFGLRNEAIVSLIWDFWGP